MRLKISLVILVFISLVITSNAEENNTADSAAKPQASSDNNSSLQAAAKVPQAYFPESNFIFQSILEGTEFAHDFVIQNKGEATLNIEKVKTG